MNNDKPLLGVYGERDLVIERGQGSYVWDADGRRYLDCISGVAVNALGHSHPAVVGAIRCQAGRIIHASNLFVTPTQVELAKKLVELSGFDAVFFSNSGAEANEGAFKFARHYFVAAGNHERFEIVSFSGSFHGRTYAAMAATGQDKIQNGFGPLPPGFVIVPVNDTDALRKAVGPKTAAVIYEPVLAEGGVIDLLPEMARALGEIQAQGVFLIADEIQTGFWRTGTFLGSEALGLKPDLVTLAKPLGGGLPLGAVLVKARIAASLKAGDHGSTFGGNPVACAAGLAVLEILSDPEFIRDLHERMTLLRRELEALVQVKAASGIKVGPISGRGFLIGIKMGGDVSVLQKKLRVEGVLAHRAGVNVLRLLPPLTISRDEMKELLGALERALV
jgi:predicted acetylornithine/succinylornithine family transaminase